MNRRMAFRYGLIFLWVALGWLCAPSWGKTKREIQLKPFLFYGAINLGLASPASDKVLGASYTQNMRTPILGTLGLGYFALKPLWIGIRYEFWVAQRKMSLAGVNSIDKLNLQLLGPEVAYVRGNPRVSYLFAAGGTFPLKQQIDSNVNGVFQTGATFWNYHLRTSLELRFNTQLALHLEGGYRWVKVRGLSSSSGSFLANGGDVDLSGPFVGIGLGFLF